MTLTPSELAPPPVNSFVLYPRINASGIRLLVAEAPYVQTEAQAEARKTALTLGSKRADAVWATAFEANNRLSAADTPGLPYDPAPVDALFGQIWTDAGLPPSI